MKRSFLLLPFFVFSLFLTAQSVPEEVDLNWVLSNYPKRVKRLFRSLDLEHPGLREVKTAAAGGQYRSACLHLIDYYRSGDNFPELRDPDAGDVDLAKARHILVDTFTFQNRTAAQRRHVDSTLDWTYRGPKDDAEWAHFLNRHQWFSTILKAYRQSGDIAFARYLNRSLLDWIISNPFPVADECCPQWRTLNTGIRFSSWPAVFYGMQQSEVFSDAARILMLISVTEQAGLIERFHWTHQNHALYELNGLARIAVFWPELRRADEWFDYAARHLLYEMEGQVLPDGVQDELTSMYHFGALRLFQEVVDLGAKTGKSLPPALRAGVEKMYHYLAYTMRPDGYNVQNNDADRNDFRPYISQAGRLFDRPDWAYIISNGQRGQEPEQGAVLFPYAGQVIMRNGWNEQAHWSYFDAGPHGTAHRHDDKLHLSVAAYGRDLLVDGGRYWYRPDIWREYFVSSFSHNVILVDGFGHQPDVGRYTRPDQVAFETNANFTYAQATFDAGFRQVDDKELRHTRGVLYLHDHFWIVIDQLTSSKPHTIQPLWHFHPSCHVVADGEQVFSDDPGKGNLLIQPLGATGWTLDVHFGPDSIANPDAYREWRPRAFDEFPVKGAYSKSYNEKEPGYVAVYSRGLEGEMTFAWLLIPFEGDKRPKALQTTLEEQGGNLLLTITDGVHRHRVRVNLEKGKIEDIDSEEF